MCPRHRSSKHNVIPLHPAKCLPAFVMNGGSQLLTLPSNYQQPFSIIKASKYDWEDGSGGNSTLKGREKKQKKINFQLEKKPQENQSCVRNKSNNKMNIMCNHAGREYYILWAAVFVLLFFFFFRFFIRKHLPVYVLWLTLVHTKDDVTFTPTRKHKTLRLNGVLSALCCD